MPFPIPDRVSRLISALLLALACVTFAAPAIAQGAPAATVPAKPAAKPAPKKAGSAAFVPQTTIVWRGDIVSARGVTNDLVAAFRKEKSGLLTVETFSTISGIDGVRAGSADVAGVARPMHELRDEE